MRQFLLLILFFSFALSLGSANAQDNKAWLNKISTAPPGPHLKVRPMLVTYGVSWKGKINAGKMELKITEPYPGVYLSQASGKSTGLARAVFTYDFQGSAQTNAESLQPLTFNFSDKMKNKGYTYSLLFQPNQMISQTDLTNFKTKAKTPYHTVYRFEKDIARDLMSSILYLRSLPLTNGQKVSLVTATFNKPYLTNFTVSGRETLTIKRKKYNTIKLEVIVSKILPDMTTESYSKVERATIWISDDAYRIPLEIQGEIFIGYVSAKMTSRKFL